MNDVEGDFNGRRVAELARAGLRNGCADENLPVGKCDHIGRSWDAQKIAMDSGHSAWPENRDLNGIQSREGGLGFFCELDAGRQGGPGNLFHEDLVVDDGTLTMGKMEVG